MGREQGRQDPGDCGAAADQVVVREQTWFRTSKTRSLCIAKPPLLRKAIRCRNLNSVHYAQLFAPLVQIVTFAIISSLVMALFVLLLALLLRGSRPDTDLLVAVIALLPQTIIDGITVGFLYTLIALGYTMVYGVLEFINFAQ